MNHETELNIQAHLDGELSAAEQRQVIELIRTDAEAGALFESLSATRRVLVENEPQLTLPETREFYWSKIERAIQRQAAASERVSPGLFGWSRWWLRLGVPFAGAAIVLALIVIGPRFGMSPDVELPTAAASTITFQTENMTVVWVQSE